MKLTTTEVEKYAKDYIESKAYLDRLREKRRMLNIEFEEQENRHETLESEILDKFENPAPIAVIIGKKIFTITGCHLRRASHIHPIQIWNVAES